MKLVDKNQHQFRQGIYTGGNINFPESSQFYKVFKTYEGWKARGINGEIYSLAYPRGLPDSSIMPQGQIDASELSYVKKTEADMVLSKLTKQLRETAKKMAFLEDLVHPIDELK